MKKPCSKCGIPKDLEEFLKDKTKKDGHRSDCTECRNKTRRKNHDPEKNKAHNKKWHDKNIKPGIERRAEDLRVKKSKNKFNAELKPYLLVTIGIFKKQASEKKTKEIKKQYAKNHPEQQRKAHDKWYEKNKHRQRAISREYHRENQYKITAQKRNRRHTDPEYKIEITCRNRIKDAIKRQNAVKQTKTIDLIGCSYGDLKRHLESLFHPGMTWENHAAFGWHIDHRKPCASFDLTDPEQQKECFHYTNLQPLWWQDNLAKGSSLSQAV